jgi:plastocyanin
MGLSPGSIRRVATIVPVVAAVGLTGCGGGGDADSTSAAPSVATTGSHTVTIEGFAFEPADLTIARGTTVAFPNEDGSPHTATSERSGAFDTGTIKPGAEAELTFDESGTFAYYCAFHPFMKGTVTVA